MKLVKQSYEILEQEIPVRKPDDSDLSYKDRYLQAMYRHIERCGRVCYHSLDKITESSAEKFVNGLIKSKHLSVLEHGVVYLKIPTSLIYIISKYVGNNYSKWTSHSDFTCITTNYRVIIENSREDDLRYLCEPTEYHEKRHTVLLHTCIHVYKDLTRHRKMSFSIESTRYCNYSKTDKFGEMKFVLPPWINYEHPTETDKDFFSECIDIEYRYNKHIKNGWQPQQAAEILPQCTAADVVMSGYDSDWEFVMELRVLDKTGKAHPLVHDVLDPLYDDMCHRGWLFNITGDE